jgi:hypothetical protein
MSWGQLIQRPVHLVLQPNVPVNRRVCCEPLGCFYCGEDGQGKTRAELLGPGAAGLGWVDKLESASGPGGTYILNLAGDCCGLGCDDHGAKRSQGEHATGRNQPGTYLGQ